MRRNVKIVLLLSCAWMFAFVYYYHTSRDTKARGGTELDADSLRLLKESNVEKLCRPLARGGKTSTTTR
ncbi:uncharacterized protein LOC122538708 isoform X2 [Frieseomelitta varia]|uniref:uncharacterized protein LOC122538708 isoform X2 n=1 Tax=Frieseomelitta varia TaxID=561572 RepID=UPI001CB6A1B3|nr:uncharacterized protein LOC122538708 isoform X2 [Frieseomelitta varia]